MNKQLLLILLMSMVGSPLHAAHGDADAKRVALERATQALKDAHAREAGEEELAQLLAALRVANEELTSSDDSDGDSTGIDSGDEDTPDANDEKPDTAAQTGSWNTRRIGIAIGGALFYRYIIAPRLAKRVRKMQKGRMRKILRVLTFAKRAA